MEEKYSNSYLQEQGGITKCTKCTNYESHYKTLERVIEHRFRQETTILENQFGFMLRHSTMKAIFSLRHLMEKYREASRSSYGF